MPFMYGHKPRLEVQLDLGLSPVIRRQANSTEIAEFERWKREQEYLAHCAEHKLDPNWIGTNEVKPVHCVGCGAVIPWAVLRGFGC